MKVSGKLKVTWEMEPAVYDMLRTVMAGLQETGMTDDDFWVAVLEIFEKRNSATVFAVPGQQMDSGKVLEKEFRAGYDTAMLEVQKKVGAAVKAEYDRGFNEGYDTGMAEGVEKGIEDTIAHNEAKVRDARTTGYEAGCRVGAVHEAEKYEARVGLATAVASEHRVPGNDPPLCASGRKFEKIASILGEMMEK